MTEDERLILQRFIAVGRGWDYEIPHLWKTYVELINRVPGKHIRLMRALELDGRVPHARTFRIINDALREIEGELRTS